MEQSLITKFFSLLSTRQRNENHLSDITWAMCESCPEFKHYFLAFFFGENPEFKRVSMQRECSRGKSRSDFYFKIGEQEYIIENKIYDRNDHFDQYIEDFKGATFGWIANYTVRNREGVVIRNWESFKQYLENSIIESNYSIATRDIIESYVCLLYTSDAADE